VLKHSVAPPLPIRLRLALWYSLFLLASVVGIGIFLITLLERELHREVDEALSLRAARVEAEIAEDLAARTDPHAIRAELIALTPLEEFSSPGIYVQVVDEAGAPIAVSGPLGPGQLPVTTELLQSALRGQSSYTTLPAGAEEVRVLVRPLLNAGTIVGAVEVGESLHLFGVTQRTMRQLLVVAALIAANACLVGGWWLTAHALKPLAEVTGTARRITETGKFGDRIPVPAAKDELRQLSLTFNEMLASLERAFERQRQFVADASHELRGPLMVIRGNLNLLAKEPGVDERKEAVRDAEEEADRVSRLVADLLFLAEMDATEVVDRRPVALGDVLVEVVQRARLADGGSHIFEVREPAPVTLMGDRERLVQLLWNLVENALKYTPAGGRVLLETSAAADSVLIEVSDPGIGIAEADLPHIFDRFYRADRARTRGDGGTGLGLAIAKHIAELHGGDITVRSKVGSGSTFTVVLPTV
jgi:two-component system, OmpR family, sensor kinase